MYKRVGCVVLICLFIFGGCMNSKAYEDEDIAAIVRGEEITVGDLRFLYPDDAIIEMIDGMIKAKLAEQEVNKMNIDVSKQLKEIKTAYEKYPSDHELHTAKAQSIRAFAEPQASKLGMDPEDFYKQYTKISTEIAAPINAYVAEVLGEIENDEFGIEEYNDHANELLDDLMEQNKDEIEIRTE